MTLSVVLRTKNEMRTLPGVIAALQRQVGVAFELVIVDNCSTDGTFELAKRHAQRVMTIERFSHAASTNLGVSAAEGDRVYLSNGHSWPASDHLLRTGMARMDADPSLAGVYGRSLPAPGASPFERLVGLRQRLTRPNVPVVHDGFVLGMMHTISSMFRRDVALALPFRELPSGGEDTLWALEALHAGWRFAFDPALSAYHFHAEGNLAAFRRQLVYKRLGRQARAEARRLGFMR